MPATHTVDSDRTASFMRTAALRHTGRRHANIPRAITRCNKTARRPPEDLDGALRRLRDATAELPYFARIIASVMSSMRFEKPHSLSYQLSTLTSVPPMTRVWVAS
jgi:hypothetical protein